MSDQITDSPCVRNCCLNDDDICLGCGRSLTEITSWSTLDETGKKSILKKSNERLQMLKK